MYKLIRSIDKTKLFIVAAYVLIALFTVAYVLIVLHRYWQFQYFFTDNVYFQKAFWDVARFELPIVQHKFLGEIVILGDHFSPTIFFLSLPLPLYRGSEFTQLAMIIPFSIGMVFAVHLAHSLLHDKVRVLFLVMFSYLYLGFQHAMIFGFHEIHFTPLFFWMMVWAYFMKRKMLYIVFIALLLLTKESMPMVVFCWGAFLLLSQGASVRKHAMILMTVAILYFFVVIGVVIPALGGKFLYAPDLGEASASIFTLVSRLFTPEEKIYTFIISVASFGFLPLLNFATLPLVLQDFVMRYISSIPGNNQYSLTFHYGIALTPMLTFSSLWSLYLTQNNTVWRRVTSILLIVGLAITLVTHWSYQGRGPLHQVVISDFYNVTRDNSFLWELIDKTPRDSVVMTMNHLGFALADRDVHQLTSDTETFKRINPEYIVYDKRSDQSPANILPFMNFDEYFEFIELLENDSRFVPYFEKGTLKILKRKS
jgi:uncharacterized membrane protein